MVVRLSTKAEICKPTLKEEFKIRAYQSQDLNNIMQIWFGTNIQTHSFIPKDYWYDNFEQVNSILPKDEIFGSK